MYYKMEEQLDGNKKNLFNNLNTSNLMKKNPFITLDFIKICYFTKNPRKYQYKQFIYNTDKWKTYGKPQLSLLSFSSMKCYARTVCLININILIKRIVTV